MMLPQGTRIGPYEVVALIGKGGMGEVYRARDMRLGRHVAVKVLSQEFTSDPFRVERFEREARALAALNHPHIATIHGVEEAEGIAALVMELVDGDTLAERIVRGRLPVERTLALAGQIAEALDAAHEKGIVHRDLKPANVKVTSTGTIKVLDFGLAKGGEADSRAGDLAGTSDASRVTAVATIDETAPGMLLGTAAYMSPEQARGQAVDKRTDIWAFGCLLYEMLTGRPPFARATVTDTLAAVIEHEPDWDSLPSDVPPGVVRVVRKCLEKDPRRRLRDLGDWNIAVEPAAVTAPDRRRAWIPWAASLAVCVAGGALLLLTRVDREPAAPAPAMRFDVPAAVALSESGQFSVSPDGRHLVFAGTGDDRILRLWVKSFDAPETKPLLGTEAEVVPVIPPMFWSPDSQFIAFYADGKIKKVSRTGGVVEVLCDVPGTAVGGAWNGQGTVMVGNTAGGLLRCSANGGVAAAAVTTTREDVDHLMPSFLPDGRHFVYLHVSRGDPSGNGLYVGDLELAPDQQPRERLIATGFGGAYVPGPADTGYLMFMRDAALLAAPFDPDSRSIIGDPVTVATPVGAFRDTAFFTASTRAVVYRGAASDFQLTWIDRQGKTLEHVWEPGPFVRFALSPEGLRAVVVRENRLNRADQDLWMVDLARDTGTRFTTDLFFESSPAWSPDGKEVWFTLGTGQGDIYRKLTGGSTASELVFRSNSSPPINPATTGLSLVASAHGTILCFTVETLERTRNDLWIMRSGQKPVPLLVQDFDQTEAEISRDGKWLAYVSNESGANEVLVRTFTAGEDSVALGESVVVSRGGGKAPHWRADSRELLYQTLAGTIMSASISSGSVGTPSEVVRVPGALSDVATSPDGQRLLVALPTRQATPQPFTVLVNWQTSLGK